MLDYNLERAIKCVCLCVSARGPRSCAGGRVREQADGDAY